MLWNVSFHLHIPARAQLLRIVVAQHGVHQRGSQVAASLTSFYDNLGYFRKGFHHVFGLLHMHKAYRCGNGCALPLRIRSQSSISAVGALPNTKKASGCSSTARRMPAWVRVRPFSAAIVAVRGSPR